MRGGLRFARACVVGALALSCGAPPASAPLASASLARAQPVPPPTTKENAPPPLFSEWEKASFGGVMRHRDLPDTFDLMVHFHVGKPAEDDYRASDVRAVVAALDHGLFAKAYGDAYEDKARWPKMVEAITEHVREREGRPSMAPGRIALVAWSAGYGAVRKVLAQKPEAIDSVILLDGLHTAYRYGWRSKAVDLRDLDPFMRLARDAADGKKLLVITHSAIVPGDYASTTETANKLISLVGARRVTTDLEPSAGLTPTSRADQGDLHVRAYEGDSKESHIAQLHLVKLALDQYLVPRWNR